ncbi:hypothetical protein GCM10009779_18620 [Polymorphospora rubra]|uniref:Uncharacterized protein n=2 Tax=Polymorphospora rubra TaxID=338584 RepID=A0A810N0X5_9ACTN|nr:hypothetical protein Prubr_24540 [Polymorphospora rubra]
MCKTGATTTNLGQPFEVGRPTERRTDDSPHWRPNDTLPRMAVRGWGGPIATAIGSAAGAGAAQLGLGYGLGIITWLPTTGAGGDAGWVASLAWAAWIAATSTIIGAICAERLSTPPGDRLAEEDHVTLATTLWRVVIAVAAAVGALVTVALVAVPARAATRADTFSPQTIAAGYAVVGVVGGLLVAIWALASRAVARNVVATVGWLWLLAVIAVVDGVLSGRGLTSAQLGVWQITNDSERFWIRDYFYWPGAVLALGSALVIGVLAAWRSARSARTRVGTAVSGGLGPLLVAAAYFLAAPRLSGIQAEQLSAHLLAPYAVIAGLAGSVLVTALAQRGESRRRATAAPGSHGEPPTEAEPGTVPAQPVAAEVDRTDAGPIPSAPAAKGAAAPVPTGRPAPPPEPLDAPTPAKTAAVEDTPDLTKPPAPAKSTRSTKRAAPSPRAAKAAKPAAAPKATASAKPAKASAPVPPPSSPDGPGSPDPDLEEDAYAPARAYVSETSGAATAAPAAGSAGGAPAQPLWPAGTLPGDDPQPAPETESKAMSRLRRLGRRSR